ncbi:hypothetical protein ACEPPN_008378 [Leptodophora sp. 'Broadleaf-Isolate-01']
MGSSVAETFVQEHGWSVRGISRDPSKPSAKAWIARGIGLVAADLDLLGSIGKAFSGANVFFGTTDFVQHLLDPKMIAKAQEQRRSVNELATEHEFKQAKSLIDAVAANISTIDLFVLSTLSDTKGLSHGKIQYNLHFDCKWAAVEYLKENSLELWKKTSLL